MIMYIDNPHDLTCNFRIKHITSFIFACEYNIKNYGRLITHNHIVIIVLIHEAVSTKCFRTVPIRELQSVGVTRCSCLCTYYNLCSAVFRNIILLLSPGTMLNVTVDAVCDVLNYFCTNILWTRFILVANEIKRKHFVFWILTKIRASVFAFFCHREML